ncbi:hypothetical protein HK096_000947 [Nowakowskiella sp. JEL0078]|nr:hypothetical protein HK096_000947 [Nowakowskiella sp. JEL0078]
MKNIPLMLSCTTHSRPETWGCNRRPLPAVTFDVKKAMASRISNSFDKWNAINKKKSKGRKVPPKVVTLQQENVSSKRQFVDDFSVIDEFKVVKKSKTSNSGDDIQENIQFAVNHHEKVSSERAVIVEDLDKIIKKETVKVTELRNSTDRKIDTEQDLFEIDQNPVVIEIDPSKKSVHSFSETLNGSPKTAEKFKTIQTQDQLPPNQKPAILGNYGTTLSISTNISDQPSYPSKIGENPQVNQIADLVQQLEHESGSADSKNFNQAISPSELGGTESIVSLNTQLLYAIERSPSPQLIDIDNDTPFNSQYAEIQLKMDDSNLNLNNADSSKSEPPAVEKKSRRFKVSNIFDDTEPNCIQEEKNLKEEIAEDLTDTDEQPKIKSKPPNFLSALSSDTSSGGEFNDINVEDVLDEVCKELTDDLRMFR